MRNLIATIALGTGLVAGLGSIAAKAAKPGGDIAVTTSLADYNPVAEAYRSYMKMPYDRPTWDLTAVLYAVRPDENYFSLSLPGTITVLPDGSSHFEPSANGHHRYLIIKDEQRARTLEAMIILASEPPAGSARH